MSAHETIPVREAVEAYLRATGSSPSLADQILAGLDEPGANSLDLLDDALPYFLKDGGRGRARKVRRADGTGEDREASLRRRSNDRPVDAEKGAPLGDTIPSLT